MASIVLSADFFDQPLAKSSHFHDCHQIIYVTHGSATIHINRKSFIAPSGSLVLFSRFENHAVTANTDDYHRYVLEISSHIPITDPNRYQLFSILYNRPYGFSNLFSLNQNRDEIETIIRYLVKEQQTPSFLGDEMKDLLIQQLLICLFRQSPGNFPQINETTFELVHHLQKEIETKYQTNITLTGLAEKYNISVSYLSHMFKKVTGSSVIDYLMSCRLAAAKQYLAKSNYGIGEIVELCGFSDNSNFSRFFRKNTGFSPSQFRKIYH